MSLNQEPLKDRTQKRSRTPSTKGRISTRPIPNVQRKTWSLKSLKTKDLMKDRRNKIWIEQATVSIQKPNSAIQIRAGTVTMFFEGYSTPKLTGQRFVVATTISGKARKHAGMKPGETLKRKNRFASYRQANSNFETEIDHLKIQASFI